MKAVIIGATGTIGYNTIISGNHLVVGNSTRSLPVHNSNGLHIALHILHDIVVEVKGSAAGGVKAPQINILHRGAVHFEIVESTRRIINDDAVAGIHRRRQRRIVTVGG